MMTMDYEKIVPSNFLQTIGEEGATSPSPRQAFSALTAHSVNHSIFSCLSGKSVNNQSLHAHFFLSTKPTGAHVGYLLSQISLAFSQTPLVLMLSPLSSPEIQCKYLFLSIVHHWSCIEYTRCCHCHCRHQRCSSHPAATSPSAIVASFANEPTPPPMCLWMLSSIGYQLVCIEPKDM